MPKAYAFLSYGQGGKAVATALSGNGIGRLASRIKALDVETSPPFDWDDYNAVAIAIRKLPKTAKVIVGGVSLGANMAPWIAAKVYPRPVDYIFGIQPSLLGGHYTIPKNVKSALCIYNPFWLMTFGLGAYAYERTEDNHNTVLTTRTRYVLHPGDNDEQTQGFILADIAKLIGG